MVTLTSFVVLRCLQVRTPFKPALGELGKSGHVDGGLDWSPGTINDCPLALPQQTFGLPDADLDDATSWLEGLEERLGQILAEKQPADDDAAGDDGEDSDAEQVDDDGTEDDAEEEQPKRRKARGPLG